LLINVTTFFRDAKTFDLLANEIIPDLVESHDGEHPLRVWVAGCSSGEEAYSIAILIMEAIATAKRPIKLQMFASDVDADAVVKAREGLYPEAVAVDITPARLKRFFTRDEQGYRVNRDLRDAIVFTVQDVLLDPPFSRLDLISCRNLLIYLTPRAQAKVISLFHFALRNRGLLLLGSAETIGNPAGRFEVVSKLERIYRQIGQGRLGLSDFDVGAAAEKAAQIRGAADNSPTRASGFADLTRSLVLETLAPAAVLIDRGGKCLYSLGPTDRYLRVASGYPSHDLLEMATPALRAKLRAAIGRVGKDNRRVFSGHSRIGATSFGIDVQAVTRHGEELLLIAFIDDPIGVKRDDSAKLPTTNARMGDLEHELALTRDELRIALADLETSNQEQKAINEEALSVNEEYQSTNEELLTSKEELQSLNEELTALNGQLQETLERQRSTADDLQNVLYSTDVATMFLDPDLNIRFFTPATRAVFNVIPGDVGRPLTDLRSLAVDERLADDARQVLKGAAAIEYEIEVPSGSWFMRRIVPYHTHDKKIEGVVITFVDITERKSSAKALSASKREAELTNIAKSRFLAAASHDLRQPLQSLSLLQSLLTQSADGENAVKLVARLGQTLDSMTGMLNVLLDINQIEAGAVQPEQVDFVLDDLFSRMRDEFASLAQAQRLEFRVRTCALRVHSDPRLLEQMVRNLLANAFKYTRTGRILLGCRKTGTKMRIEIWDTGIGISENELHVIFDEFHQIDNAARERSKGLGLGLSIVQRLGALLDHDIGVRSKLGKGSVFSIEVPLATYTVASAGTEVPGQQPRAATGNIIIIEDDPDVRDLLEQLLKTSGHRVRTAANGVAALDLVSNGAIRPDLVLADYNLPGATNGLDAIRQIRKVLDRALPGIILTGDISKATRATITGSDYVLLSKPIKAQELKVAIEAMLGTSEPISNLPSLQQAGLSDAVIIIVDDDADVRMSIRDVLEDDGHVVEDFPDAESYLTAYRSDREGCLLLDAGLPGIGGLELLERLQKMGSPMPTIMLTGSYDLTLAISAMKAGASDFIEKPVGRGALMESIGRALSRSHGTSIVHAFEETAARHVAGLTRRQREIMNLVLAGHPSKNIAADLGISQRTVENHRASIMQRMEAKSLPELARQALAAERKSPLIDV
jgi:two-component system CheB/CheR fusion protein